MYKMPPPMIDPNALMNALTPALQSNGGLAGPTHALRVISILRDTKKLISKAVYLKVFQQHAPEAMDAFTHNGGWELLHQWLTEVSDKKMYHFMHEMIQVYKLLPVSVDLLKSNSTAKIIRQLKKDMDAPEDVRHSAANLTEKWIDIVRQTHSEANVENGDIDVVKVKKAKSENRKKHPLDKPKKEKKRHLSAESDHILQNAVDDPEWIPDEPKLKKYHTNSQKSVQQTSSDFQPNNLIRKPQVTQSKSLSDKDSKSNSSSIASVDPVIKKRNPAATTVKTARTQFRKTGLESLSGPPKKKVKSKDDSPQEKKKIPQSTPNAHSLVDTILNINPPTNSNDLKKKKEGVLSSSTSTKDGVATSGSQNKTKQIPPKPKPIQMLDSAAFMNSLDAPRLPPMKKKKKVVTGDKKPGTPTTPTTPDTPVGSSPLANDTTSQSQRTSPTSTKKLDIYKETTDITKLNKAKNESEDSESKSCTKVENNTNESTIKQEQKPVVEEAVKKPDNGTPTGSILLTDRRKKIKRSVSFANAEELTKTFYFELDETERVNVNRVQFENLKHMEMHKEGKAFSDAKKLMEGEDPYTPSVIDFWKPLIPIDYTYPDTFPLPSSGSIEKAKEEERQKSVLQELYLGKEYIPDTAKEPDYEEHEKKTPVTIPLLNVHLDDVSSAVVTSAPAVGNPPVVPLPDAIIPTCTVPTTTTTTTTESSTPTMADVMNFLSGIKKNDELQSVVGSASVPQSDVSQAAPVPHDPNMYYPPVDPNYQYYGQYPQAPPMYPPMDPAMGAPIGQPMQPPPGFMGGGPRGPPPPPHHQSGPRYPPNRWNQPYRGHNSKYQQNRGDRSYRGHSREVCRHFLSSKGCKFEKKCKLLHPQP